MVEIRGEPGAGSYSACSLTAYVLMYLFRDVTDLPSFHLGTSAVLPRHSASLLGALCSVGGELPATPSCPLSGSVGYCIHAHINSPIGTDTQ